MRTLQSLPVAALLVAGIIATALGQAGPVYDPQQLPALEGKVAQYSLTPRGDVDGLILEDGTEIHLPPHLGAQLVFAVKPGDRITVHGLKARTIAMVQAVSVTNDATGATVTDNGPGGPPGPRDSGTYLSAQGHIKRQLHGPAETSTEYCSKTAPLSDCRPRKPIGWRLSSPLANRSTSRATVSRGHSER